MSVHPSVVTSTARAHSPVGDAARLICALALALSLATLPQIGGWVAPFVAATLLGAMALLRPNPGLLARRFALCVPVISLLAVPFLIGGRFDAAGRLAFRALSAALTVLTFTAGMTPGALARALRSLRVPESLVEVLDGLLLGLEGLAGIARRIVLAQRLRGARGPRLFARLLPELLVQSAERAQRVDLARRLRGDSHPRVRQPLSPADWLSVVTALACGLVMHYLATR